MKRKWSFVIIALTVLFLCSCDYNNNRNKFYNGEYIPTQISIVDNGKNYNVLAVKGQCIVFFKEGLTYDQINSIVDDNGGRIIEQMPEFGYYLVSVEDSTEYDFVVKMKNEELVEYVFLNTISSINSNVYIIDDFVDVEENLLTTHGNAVKIVFSKYSGMNSYIHNINREIMNNIHAETQAGAYWQAIKILCTANSLCTEFLNIAKQEKFSNDVILINLSFGVGLNGDKRQLYDSVTEDAKGNYNISYANELANMAMCFDKMRRRGFSNFIVTKSSGNEGMHKMDLILNELDPLASQSLKTNMVLVNAYDNKESVLYSNNVSEKHSLVSMVDISHDLWSGTSFAAPKLLGYIDRIKTKYNTLNAQDILTAVRNATPDDIQTPMTYEMLENAASEIAESKKQCMQFQFVLDMTSNYSGQWDLSEGKGLEIVKYKVHDTYGYNYLSGDEMAIDIENMTNYNLELYMEVLDKDTEIRSLRCIIEKGKKESFYANSIDFGGNSKHISVQQLHVIITTW